MPRTITPAEASNLDLALAIADLVQNAPAGGLFHNAQLLITGKPSFFIKLDGCNDFVQVTVKR